MTHCLEMLDHSAQPHRMDSTAWKYNTLTLSFSSWPLYLSVHHFLSNFQHDKNETQCYKSWKPSFNINWKPFVTILLKQFVLQFKFGNQHSSMLSSRSFVFSSNLCVVTMHSFLSMDALSPNYACLRILYRPARNRLT